MDKNEPVSITGQLAALEALLFVAAQPVALRDLQKALEIEADWLRELLATLNSDYEANGRGLRLALHADTCQLVTAPGVAVYVERFLGLQSASKLSAAALETLTIVAYRQPITRQQIETLRGVDSNGVINTLQARGFIEEIGRADTVGHPVLFGTTPEFLHYFGLASLTELPSIEGLTTQPASPSQPQLPSL